MGEAAGRPRGASLTAQVAAALRREIEGGARRPGDRLPPEPALIARFGVSRTVVREAVAALRADGLVESRQGAGVFVREAPPAPEGLSLLTGVSRRLPDIIETLELRAAVEIEAAGLAAERASPAQEAEIEAELARFTAAMAAGEPTEAADFAFHRAVARATNNARFEEFLAFLGRRTIPRAELRAAGGMPAEGLDARIVAEHRAVADAIAARDPAAARRAMRAHLVGSLDRYRALSRRSG
jgi:DNA-binding FadR family transcriptional regulator